MLLFDPLTFLWNQKELSLMQQSALMRVTLLLERVTFFDKYT